MGCGLIRFPEINVWFSVFGFAVGCFLIIRLPPRLPRTVSALIMMMSLALPLGLDHSIGVAPIDLYDTNVHPWLTFSELPSWGMYPIFGYLFIYVYDKWNIRGLAIPIYVLGWSLFGVAFEALSVTFDIFRYKGWSLRYSFLVYILTQLLTIIVFRILMSMFFQAKEEKR
jgi:hypothetical protein